MKRIPRNQDNGVIVKQRAIISGCLNLTSRADGNSDLPHEACSTNPRSSVLPIQALGHEVKERALSTLPKKDVMKTANQTTLFCSRLLERPVVRNQRQFPELPSKSREISALNAVRVLHIIIENCS